MQAIYTATATATGDGRNGRTESEDGLLAVDVRIPKEMGGPGGATNPRGPRGRPATRPYYARRPEAVSPAARTALTLAAGQARDTMRRGATRTGRRRRRR